MLFIIDLYFTMCSISTENSIWCLPIVASIFKTGLTDNAEHVYSSNKALIVFSPGLQIILHYYFTRIKRSLKNSTLFRRIDFHCYLLKQQFSH